MSLSVNTKLKLTDLNKVFSVNTRYEFNTEFPCIMQRHCLDEFVFWSRLVAHSLSAGGRALTWGCRAVALSNVRGLRWACCGPLTREPEWPPLVWIGWIGGNHYVLMYPSVVFLVRRGPRHSCNPLWEVLIRESRIIFII